MSIRIRKVAVLGAGVMGSGIAGHLANAGIPSLLLDIVPPKAAEGEATGTRLFRDKFAASALVQLGKAKPAPLFTARATGLIEVGNFDDDLARISECDWVVEVVKEDLKVKQAIFERVDKHMKPGSIISSNTSGMSIKGMTEGRSAAFRKNFLVTHFFNPVRYMRLLELVAGEQTSPEVMKTMAKFGEEILGKGIVFGKDTTNFIANRIGTYGMMRILNGMQQAELSIEEADKIFGQAMGRPKSAVFNTADVVGLDTFSHVAKNCYDTLTNDEERETFKLPEFVEKLVAKGSLGRKSGAGFYRKDKATGEIHVLDLKTLDYRPQNKVRFESLGAAKDLESIPEKIQTVMNGTDKAAKFAERVTLETLAYASRRIPEIADDYVNIDRGLRWGFGWDVGPFETWDAYGVKKGLDRMAELGLKPGKWVTEMVAGGREKFYEADKKTGADTYWDIQQKKVVPVTENAKTIRVEYLKRGNKQIQHNDSATLWDMGDGCTLLEFHSKMNSIDDDITSMMEKALLETEKNHKALVIGNDGANFSAGANIMALLMAVRSDAWDDVRKLVSRFQQANQAMRYSPVPVVAAPFNLTLGGGAEVTMGANAVQASAELYMGLVEVGVGLIPGGGGNLMLLRNLYGRFASDKDFDALPFLKKCFLAIGTAKVATSAEEAAEMGFLGHEYGLSLNKELLLSDAKARALGMANAGFRPPRETMFRLPGRSGAATIDMMLYDMQLNQQISEHDRKIGKKLASVLTGGDVSPSGLVSEDRLLELELEAFLSLCGEEKSQARIESMLMTGKPLRN